MSKVINWDGEGEPPVGCRCQYKVSGGKTWFECEVIAYHGVGYHRHVWVVKLDEKVNAKPLMRFNDVTFMPLKVGAELLVEEAENLLEKKFCAVADHHDMLVVTRMIELGYRLVPEVPKDIAGFTFFKGDDSASIDGFTAGIHTDNHGNMIEVYGSKVHATATRDYILQLMSLNNPDLT